MKNKKLLKKIRKELKRLKSADPQLKEYINHLPPTSLEAVYSTTQAVRILNKWAKEGIDRGVKSNIFYALLVEYVVNNGVESLVEMIKNGVGFLAEAEQLDGEYASFVISKLESVFKGESDDYKEMYK